jgi:ankyrin repeat protein
MDTDRPLIQAIQNRDLAAARTALAADELDATEPLAGGLSPLLFALYHGARDIAELLSGFRPPDVFEAAALDAAHPLAQRIGADPALLDAYSVDGWTALHLAAFFGARNALLVLVGLGAQLEARSKNPMMNTPLHAAVSGAAAETLAPLLIALGADVRAVGGTRITALHLAAARGYAPLCKLLIARGAPRDVVTDDGKTAADLARDRNHAALAAMLDLHHAPDKPAPRS